MGHDHQHQPKEPDQDAPKRRHRVGHHETGRHRHQRQEDAHGHGIPPQKEPAHHQTDQTMDGQQRCQMALHGRTHQKTGHREAVSHLIKAEYRLEHIPPAFPIDVGPPQEHPKDRDHGRDGPAALGKAQHEAGQRRDQGTTQPQYHRVRPKPQPRDHTGHAAEAQTKGQEEGREPLPEFMLTHGPHLR